MNYILKYIELEISYFILEYFINFWSNNVDLFTQLLFSDADILLFVSRLLIKDGSNIDSLPLYDSYAVEYLPTEGVTSTGRHLFVEFTSDEMGTCTGAAIRYEGTYFLYFLNMTYSCLPVI